MRAAASTMHGTSDAAQSSIQIGMNRRGKWVVRDAAGRRGGVFTGRREALRFALSTSGQRPDAVVMVPWPLELLPQSPAFARH